MEYPDLSEPENIAGFRALGTMGRPLSELAHDITIDGPAGDLRLRIIRPDGPVSAVMIDVHGGGWTLGLPEEDDWINDLYATQAGIASVAMEYRLAPELPSPAALEDVVAAALWIAEHAQEEFGTDRLLVQGASAGGHLAAQLLLVLRDEHPEVFARIAAASLVYGVYDIGQTPSQRRAGDAVMLPDHWIASFIDNYWPGLDAEARRDPAISPLYADLTGLPPALFTVGSLDPFLDDSLFMSGRWAAAGNRADLEVWEGGPHGFNNISPTTGAAVVDHVTTWFTARLAE